MQHTIRVTFSSYGRHTGRWYTNVERHYSLADARLRASALNWTIEKVETL